MSVSIKLQPQLITPVYNETILVLDSDKKTEPLFQWVIDVEIYGTAQSRVKLSPNPDGYGVFDMHRHIEPFITSSIDYDNKATFHRAQSAFTEYSVALSESYRIDVDNALGTNSGGFVLWTDPTEHHLSIGDKISVTNSTVPAYDGIQTVTSVPSTTSIVTDEVYTSNAVADYTIFDGSATIITGTTAFSGTNWAFNGVLPWIDVPSWKASGYTTTFADTLMLTTAPDDYEVKENDRIWFNFYNVGTPSTATVDYLRVFTYDSDGTLLGNYLIPNSFSANTDSNRFLHVGVGPWNLNYTTDSVTVTSGTLPIISPQVASYECHLYNTGNGRISKSYTFTTNFDCTGFENYRMLYLDKKGSWMNINFNLAHNVTRSVSRKTYKKNYGGYNPTTNTWGYNSYDRGETHLDSQLKEEIEIMTDYISEKAGNLVADLMESPEVYHLSEISETFNLGAINSYTFDFDGTSSWSEYNMSNPHGLGVGDEVCVTAAVFPNCKQIVRSVISPTVFTTYEPYNAAASILSITKNEMSGGVLRAVNIKTNSLKMLQRKTDKLINYKLKFEYANMNTTQRG